VGWALGVERVLELLKEQGLDSPVPVPDVYAIIPSICLADCHQDPATVARPRGAVQMHSPTGAAEGMGSMKSQFKKADASAAAFALVFGADELAAGLSRQGLARRRRSASRTIPAGRGILGGPPTIPALIPSQAALCLDLEEQEQIDQLKHFWNTWGTLISSAALVIALGLAGWNGYQFWQNRQAGQAAALLDAVDGRQPVVTWGAWSRRSRICAAVWRHRSSRACGADCR
jgi:hypothetical protein